MSETHANPYILTTFLKVNKPTWPQVIAAAGQIAREKKAVTNG